MPKLRRSILSWILLVAFSHLSPPASGPAYGWDVSWLPIQEAPSALPVSVLFLGTDVDYTRQGKRLTAVPSSFSGRSDSIMYARLDPVHKRVTIVQIPRDTQVRMGSKRSGKINGANAFGGPKLAVSTVSSLLGAPVDRYVVMNVHGLVDVVNEVGGVTVNVPKPMRYVDRSAKVNIDLKPGVHTLTGNQAMGFVRFRHDNQADIGRLQRQQLLIAAFFQKFSNPLAWVHVPALVSIAQKQLKTNITPVEMMSIAAFVHSVPKSNFSIVRLPGHVSKRGDWLVERDKTNTLIAGLNTVTR